MDWLDFYHGYVMVIIQILAGFFFFTKCLQVEVKIFSVKYLAICLSVAVLGMAAVLSVPNGMCDSVVYVLLLVAAGILLFRADGVTAALYAIVTVEILQLCFGTTNAILSILYVELLSSNLQMLFLSTFALSAAAILMSVFCYWLVFQYFVSQGKENRSYSLMLLLPMLLLFLVEDYINVFVYGNVADTGSAGDLERAGNVRLLVIQLLGIGSLFCVLFAYKKLTENFHLEVEFSLLKQEEHLLRQYVDEAKLRYESTKSFRHDIKNHMTVVRELLQEQKLQEALRYLDDLQYLAEDMSFPCNTNNPTVDILLQNKLGIARNHGIDVSCFLQLPHPCSITDMDFCIILSNALDNAIWACRKAKADTERYLRVGGSVQGDFILLQVENSCNSGSFFSPGTGFANMKSVVDKYHGTLEVEREGEVFRLNVLLIISQPFAR